MEVYWDPLVEKHCFIVSHLVNLNINLTVHLCWQVMEARPPLLPKVTSVLAGALVALGIQEHRPALNLLPLILSSLRQARAWARCMDVYAQKNLCLVTPLKRRSAVLCGLSEWDIGNRFFRGEIFAGTRTNKLKLFSLETIFCVRSFPLLLPTKLISVTSTLWFGL